MSIKFRLGRSLLLSLCVLGSSEISYSDTLSVLDHTEQDLARSARDGSPVSLAMPGPPQEVAWGPQDSDLVSPLAKWSYRSFEVEKEKLPAIRLKLNDISRSKLFDYRVVEDKKLGVKVKRASFVRSVALSEDGTGYRLYSGGPLNRHLDSTQRYIFPDQSWKMPTAYGKGEMWMEFDVSVTGQGIPLSLPSSYARPIALTLGERIFLFTEIQDESNDGATPLKVNKDYISFTFPRESDRRMERVQATYLSRLAEKARSIFHADIETQVPTFVELVHVGKNDLVDGNYEQAGYTLIVYKTGPHLRTVFNFSVLVASHPGNPHVDPTPTQAQRYKRKIDEIRDETIQSACHDLMGTYEPQRGCIVR